MKTDLPTVRMWVGVLVKDWDNFVGASNIPEDIENGLYTGCDVGVGDAAIRTFEQDDKVVGVGEEVFYTDWDYDVEELDLSGLLRLTQMKLEKVKHIFTEWGIPDKPKVYIHTDLV